MTITSNCDFKASEWSKIEACVLGGRERYKPKFLNWLRLRPVLWERLCVYTLRASQFEDSDGFSIVSLIQIVAFDSTDSDPEYIREGGLEYSRDLGRLLIDIHPETRKCLWDGEIESQEQKHLLEETAKDIEGNYSELEGFFLTGEDDPANKEEYMVFPEIRRITVGGVAGKDSFH